MSPVIVLYKVGLNPTQCKSHLVRSGKSDCLIATTRFLLERNLPVRKGILHRTFFDIHQAEEFSLLDL